MEDPYWAHRVQTAVSALESLAAAPSLTPEWRNRIERAYCQLPAITMAKRLRTSHDPQRQHAPRLLQLSREMCLQILRWCNGTTLRIVDCTCAALSVPSDSRCSIVQDSIKLRLRCTLPYCSLGVSSWAVMLERAEDVHTMAVDYERDPDEVHETGMVDAWRYNDSSRSELAFCAVLFSQSLHALSQRSQQPELELAASELLLDCTLSSRRCSTVLMRTNCIANLCVLTRDSSVPKAQLKCVRAIVNIAVDPQRIPLCVQAGVVPLLVQVASDCHSKEAQDDTAALTTKAACEGIANICFTGWGSKSVAAAGAVLVLRTLLNSAESGTKQEAARALFSLAFDGEHAPAVAAAGVIVLLVQLLRFGESSVVREQACRTLSVVCCNSELVQQLAEVPGAIEGLFRVLGCSVVGAIQRNREELFTVALAVNLLSRMSTTQIETYIVRLCAMLYDRDNWAAQLGAAKVLNRLPRAALQSHSRHLVAAIDVAVTSFDWRVLDEVHRITCSLNLHVTTAAGRYLEARLAPGIGCVLTANSTCTCPLCGCVLTRGQHFEPNYKICDVCFQPIKRWSAVDECKACAFICCPTCALRTSSIGVTN